MLPQRKPAKEVMLCLLGEQSGLATVPWERFGSKALMLRP